jgi:hypothetical protein
MVKDMQTVQVNSVACKTLSSCSCDLDLKYGIKVSTYYDCGGVRYLEEYWPNDSLTFYKWSRKDGILIDAPLAVKGDFYLESCFGDVNPFTNCFVHFSPFLNIFRLKHINIINRFKITILP